MHKQGQMTTGHSVETQEIIAKEPVALSSYALTYIAHTRHILPPSEIELGLFWADFAGSGKKHLLHRIG